MAKTNVLALIDFREAEMMVFAREWLAASRATGFFDGDPFDNATMHAEVRRVLKMLAGVHERNCARIVDLALAGAEDAIEALRDLIAEHTARGEPLIGALGTFNTIMNDRPLRTRNPHAAPPTNFLAAFVIVVLLIQLRRRFPLLKFRRSSKRHHLACSITSLVLAEAGVWNGTEEAVRKLWEKYGPPVVPGYGYRKES